MLGKGCYRIYIVLAFSCGRANTIRIRYIIIMMRTFFENGDFIRIRVEGRGPICLSPRSESKFLKLGIARQEYREG